MVSEVLNLGIKGSDLVLRQLKQIQATKKKLTEMTTVRVGGAMAVAAAMGSAATKLNEQVRSFREERKESEKPEKKEHEKIIGDKTQSVLAGAGSLDTGGLISSLGNAFNMDTFGVSGAAATMANAALTFKDKIKQAAQSWADTQSAASNSRNFAGDPQFLRSMDNTQFKSRRDISVGDQRGIVDALSSSYGKMSGEFKDSIRTLYGTRENPYDVKQTTALAQGNFESLGTDQGFFMQKIANSLQNLPPSAKQKLMPQLFSMIPDEDRAKQYDYGERATTTAFEDQDRAQAGTMLSLRGANGESAVSMAQSIQAIQNTIDTGLAGVMASLIGALSAASTKIREQAASTSAGARPPGSAETAVRRLFQ